MQFYKLERLYQTWLADAEPHYLKVAQVVPKIQPEAVDLHRHSKIFDQWYFVDSLFALERSEDQDRATRYLFVYLFVNLIHEIADGKLVVATLNTIHTKPVVSYEFMLKQLSDRLVHEYLHGVFYCPNCHKHQMADELDEDNAIDMVLFCGACDHRIDIGRNAYMYLRG